VLTCVLFYSVETAEEAEEQAGLRHRHSWLGLRWGSIWRRRIDARSWRGHDPIPVVTPGHGTGADEDIQSPLPLQDPVALPDDAASYICPIAGYEDVGRRRTSKSRTRKLC